jgi:hypothetical protein
MVVATLIALGVLAISPAISGAKGTLPAHRIGSLRSTANSLSAVGLPLR